MITLAEACTHPIAIWAGWTGVVVLWATAALAVLLAAWRAWRSAAPVAAQHRAALAALALCAASAVAAPLALAAWPVPAPSLMVTAGRTLTGAPGVSDGRAASPALPLIRPNALAGAAGIAWALGASLLLVRLAGGWLLAGRVRHRAAAIADPGVQEALRRVQHDFGLAAPVTLLESSEVEAPVVVGARAPAVILPDDLSRQLAPSALEPLLAHECAHIRRADFAANLAQSVVDALLFFSPPVRWISNVVRETREYCCDESAVAWCGDDRGGYAKILASLAALGSRNRTHALLGAAGPRLVTRVRRLLSDEALERRSIVRTFGIAAALTLVVLSASPVLRVSAAHASAAPIGGRAAGQPAQWPLPVGFATLQPGSSVVLSQVTGDADHLAASVTVRNLANVAVSSLTLAAVVRGDARDGPGRIAIVTSEALDVAVAPGATVTASTRFLSRDQLVSVAPRVGTPRQVFFGLARVRFANGAEWTTTPNPAARNEDDALSLPPGSVPRALVAAAPGSDPNAAACADDEGALTSEGGALPIRHEPGRYARCARGVWVEDGREVPPAARPGSDQKPPVPVKQVRPSYSKALMDEGIQGTVVVTITVSREGKVTEATVKKSLSPALDAEALRTARQWEFRPGTRNGVPVDVKTELEFTFTLAR